MVVRDAEGSTTAAWSIQGDGTRWRDLCTAEADHHGNPHDARSHADEAHPPRHHRRGPYGPLRPVQVARNITPRGTTR